MKKTLIYVSISLNLFTNLCSMEYEFKVQELEDSESKTPGSKTPESKICKYKACEPQSYEPLILRNPDEIKLHIFETIIKNIIKNNSIFEPFKDVKEDIKNIRLINREFNNFKPDLIKFAEKYIKKHFAAKYLGITKKEKNAKLQDVFENMNKINSNCQELEVEGAKLIIAGADPNLPGCFGNSILILAALNNYNNIAKLLIHTGADVNAISTGGNIPLLIAVRNDNIELVKLLIDSKADVNIKDRSGVNALMCSDNPQMVEMLIFAGADVNVTDPNDNTALMCAVFSGNIDIVQLLINANADINKANECGETSLILSVSNGYYDIMKLLIDSGKVDINASDNNGDTALYFAVKNNRSDMVQYLISAGADVNLKNKFDWSALTLAEFHEHEDIIKLLKSSLSAQKSK